MQKINIGNVANDGTGDTLRAAFAKANANFSAALIHVNANADKLALSGLTGGEIVSVDQEAARIEMFVGGDATQDASWAVLRNTVNLIVYNASYNGDEIINGVDCPVYVHTNVGWVDPLAIPGVNLCGNFYISGLESPETAYLDLLYDGSALNGSTDSTFPIPLSVGLRSQEVIIYLEGSG